MAGALGLASVTAFAQKGELKTAKEQLETYQTMKGAGGTLASAALTKAKEAIDKAAANEKTAQLPQTFAVKGGIYAELTVQDSSGTTPPTYAVAEEALKKAKELDTKGENTAIIDNGNRNLAQYNLNLGVKDYQGGKYAVAYNYFDKYRQIFPEDTNAIYYTGLAAANAANGGDAKFLALAIPNYTKLVTTKFSKNDDIYYELSTLQLMSKDTAAALKTIAEGITKFPTKAALRSREIEINLVSGKGADAAAKIEAAIANEPKNKSLYYYAGITYGKMADVIAEQQKKAKTPAAKAALQPKKLEHYTKAADAYKKALEIDPNYGDAALNLGYVMVNPAIDAYNAANALPANKQKEYDAGIAKANALFDAAKPFLDKAVALNPKSVEALSNLKTYYLGKKDTANANKVVKQIADLEAAGAK